MDDSKYCRSAQQFPEGRSENILRDPGPGARGIALLTLWAVLLAAGACGLAHYEFKGRIVPTSLRQWPPNDCLTLDAERPTLVFFVHPQCPCTTASIVQLDRVLSQFAGRFRTYVVMALPTGVRQAWENGRNLEAARNLPEITLLLDRGGTVTRRFGAIDSGTLLAYDPQGVLLFSGGVTASRGHEGDSLGTLVLRDIATGLPPRDSSSPVFGCPLLGDSQNRESTS